MQAYETQIFIISHQWHCSLSGYHCIECHVGIEASRQQSDEVWILYLFKGLFFLVAAPQQSTLY